MITVIKILFVAMIPAALYGLLLLCVAIPFVLWKEWRKLWEESTEKQEEDTSICSAISSPREPCEHRKRPITVDTCVCCGACCIYVLE